MQDDVSILWFLALVEDRCDGAGCDHMFQIGEPVLAASIADGVLAFCRSCAGRLWPDSLDGLVGTGVEFVSLQKGAQA